MPKRGHETGSASLGGTSTPAAQHQTQIALDMRESKRLKLPAHIDTKAKTGTGSALLDLPDELLNTIYEYVLTSDDDLLLVNGLVITEVAYPPDDPTEEEFDEESDAGNSIRRVASRTVDTQTQYLQRIEHECNQRQNEAQYLQEMEREYNQRKGEYLKKIGREFNQLKYVCKKLFRETWRLELKLNNGILFLVRNKDGSGADQIEHFLDACSISQRGWVKNITILSGEEDNAVLKQVNMYEREDILREYDWFRRSSLSSVNTLCTENPGLNVRFVPSAFRFTADMGIGRHERRLRNGEIWCAYYTHYIFRNSFPAWCTPTQCTLFRTDWDEQTQNGRNANSIPLLRASNLRIHPRNLLRGNNIAEYFKQLDNMGWERLPYGRLNRQWIVDGF